MSNEPDDNQDEVEPGFISYPMTCKEDQRKFELWVNCKDKQIWGRMGWYSYEHGCGQILSGQWRINSQL